MSARRAELLERAYRQVLTHGLADMSLRPLATAIGSSPRVLLLLFGSKDGLVRALLERARTDELTMLARIRDTDDPAAEVWQWLAAPEHRPLLVLWAEAYVRSLVDPDGPWAGFARSTVDDWLEILPTLTLAVLRGALLDLLATGDVERTTAAVASHLSSGDA
ncbi:TetR/AcrR family transcriptional regulator [Actinoplanes sp. NPDC049599]|uniref:TetR/AcrR family transcriptional regulator n=1 Tax=Actinoplanes sp. NPDC049599 TaxID=3363903 RepID=UPI0037A20D96